MVNFFKHFDKNRDNRKKFADLIYTAFRLQILQTHFINVDFPQVDNCLFAVWHGQQCCIFGIENKSNLNVMISRSRDGQIIGDVVERLGFKVIYGSKGKKGSVEATLQMMHTLENGENGVMMVDGPKGPYHVVKDGVVKIAKNSGVPIVPMYWYCPYWNFLRMPSWDGFRYPVGFVNTINLFGEPIYIDKNASKEQEEEVRLQLQRSFEKLEEIAPKKYKENYWFGLWRKKQKS